MSRCMIILACALALPGCIVHEARIDGAPAPGANAKRPGTTAMGSTVSPGMPAETVRRSHLPHELLALHLWRAPDGTIHRADAHAATDLAWWQRFPCDLAAEVWPGDLVITAQATLRPEPVQPMTEDQLLAEARSLGWADPAPTGATP